MLNKMWRINILLLLLGTIFCISSYAFEKEIKESELLEKFNTPTQLLIGDYIYFGHFYDEPILWRVVSFDQERHPILYSEEILCYKAFDGADSGIYNSEIYNEKPNPTSIEIANALGSSRWRNSTIRTWLNSNQEQVDYLFAPPMASSMYKEEYAYDKEAGFLSHFTDLEYTALVSITHKTLLTDYQDVEILDIGGTLWNDMHSTYGSLTYGHYDDIRYENVNDKVFLLSSKEFTNWIVKKDGLAIAKQSKVIEKISPHKEEFALWLRTVSFRAENPLCVYTDSRDEKYESFNDYTASEADFGIRPALCINNKMINIVEGRGDKKAPFIMGVKPYEEKKDIYNKNDYMTREEFCNLIIQLYERLSFNQAPPIGVNPFIDTANKSVIQAYQLHFLTNQNEGCFEPSKEITLEEIQEMIKKMLKVVYKDKELNREYNGLLDSKHFISRENAEMLILNIYEFIKTEIGGHFVIDVNGVKSKLEENIIINDDDVYLPAEKIIKKLGGETKGLQNGDNDEMYYIMEMATENESRINVYTSPNWDQIIINKNGNELPWITLERSPMIIDGLYMIPVEVLEKGFGLGLKIDFEKKIISVRRIK